MLPFPVWLSGNVTPTQFFYITFTLAAAIAARPLNYSFETCLNHRVFISQ